MNNNRTVVILSVLAIFGTTVRAETAVGIDVSADIFGKYIWRGQNLNNSTVFQPCIDLSYAGFTASIWGNLDMTNANGEGGEFTEWNFSLDYSAAVPGVEGLEFSVGVIQYHFPSVVGDTTEIYVGLAVDVPLNPSVTVYHDVNKAHSLYVAVGVEHSFENIFSLSPEMPVGMDIGASVGWGDADYNDYYWDGLNSSKLNDLTISVAFPVEVAGWTVSPSLNYVKLLSDDIRTTDAYAKKSDHVFAGISLSKSF